MFNTIMFFLSSIMVYIVICHHELLSFVDENDNFFDVWSLNRVPLISVFQVTYQNAFPKF